MPRTAAPGDFQVDVDGIGQFTFGRRTQRDVYRVRGEYVRLTGGNFDEDGNYRDVVALAEATISVLAVQLPEGFSIDKSDPLLDDEWESRLVRVFTVLRTKELSFRPVVRGEASQEASA